MSGPDVAIVKLFPVAVPPAVICVVVFTRFAGMTHWMVDEPLFVEELMVNVVPDVEVEKWSFEPAAPLMVVVAAPDPVTETHDTVPEGEMTCTAVPPAQVAPP